MYKHLSRLAATALITTLGGWVGAIPTAQAWDVTYSFSGNGRIDTFTGNGGDITPGEDESISGTVTFRILRVTPPAGAYTDGETFANSWDNDWVLTEFRGLTSKTSLELDPAPFDSPSDDLFYNYEVNHLWDPEISKYSNQAGLKQYRKVDGMIVRYREAFLNRMMYSDPPWFAGLGFDPASSPQYNLLYRGDYWIDYTSGADWHGTNGRFDISAWVLVAVDLAPLVSKLATARGGKGLSVLISLVQAYYDAGDTTGACHTLTAFSRQARGLSHNQDFADMVEDANLDAELIGKILGCD